ncbi:MAG: hypothetical protein IH940_02435 [Acidobacteria bacterium]|nr:hypothetical protein [Acidobacteriota bacterium]
MVAKTKSGLGRGLASLIPVADNFEDRYLDDADRVLRSLTDAGFDLLEEGSPLGLCAYLHSPANADPQLFLRTPTFESLTPTRAFQLTHVIALMSNAEQDTGAFHWEGLSCIYVRTHGSHSDGIHVVGRTSGRMDDGAAQVTREICNAFGGLAHQVQRGGSDDVEPPRLSVDQSNGTTTVSAEFDSPDGPTRTGTATATDRREAVARAVLQATEPGGKFIDVRNLALQDRKGCLVVLLDSNGVLRLGITLVSGDVMSAAAVATLRAIAGQTNTNGATR